MPTPKRNKISELQKIQNARPKKHTKRMRHKQERDMKDMKENLGSGTVECRDRAACMQALHWCYVSASLVGKDNPSSWGRNQDPLSDHTVMHDIWTRR
jgi:hypothetical protein